MHILLKVFTMIEIVTNWLVKHAYLITTNVGVITAFVIFYMCRNEFKEKNSNKPEFAS